MGLLDWLFHRKKPKPSATRIWLSKAAKYQGIAKEIRLALADDFNSPMVFVVAHFRECLEELETLIDPRKIENERLSVALVEDLPNLLRRWRRDSGRTVIMSAEKHPLKSHDDALLDSARSIAGDSVVVFHVSMEDAVMQLFAGDRVTNMLRQLGMKEDEVIEHWMVTRQIEQAQQKIAQQAFGDSRAESADEWIQRNYPVH